MNDFTDSIAVEVKGEYAEVTIVRDGDVWRLLLDEKNLARFIYSAREVLEKIRRKDERA